MMMSPPRPDDTTRNFSPLSFIWWVILPVTIDRRSIRYSEKAMTASGVHTHVSGAASKTILSGCPAGCGAMSPLDVKKVATLEKHTMNLSACTCRTANAKQSSRPARTRTQPSSLSMCCASFSFGKLGLTIARSLCRVALSRVTPTQSTGNASSGRTRSSISGGGSSNGVSNSLSFINFFRGAYHCIRMRQCVMAAQRKTKPVSGVRVTAHRPPRASSISLVVLNLMCSDGPTRSELRSWTHTRPVPETEIIMPSSSIT
mmetsp:Transcript_27496/g.72266  ORF Transcript_27496/g.72266 Transcript_27496/m.72266 type:complete len:259 (-) Transcript_27496:339-1115(-)